MKISENVIMLFLEESTKVRTHAERNDDPLAFLVLVLVRIHYKASSALTYESRRVSSTRHSPGRTIRVPAARMSKISPNAIERLLLLFQRLIQCTRGVLLPGLSVQLSSSSFPGRRIRWSCAFCRLIKYPSNSFVIPLLLSLGQINDVHGGYSDL